MKILFMGARTKRNDIKEIYDNTIKYLLVAKQLNLTSTVIPTFYKGLNRANKSRLHLPFKPYTNYKITKEIIKSHDIVIIEASLPELELGIQIEKCIRLHKPILVLSQSNDYSTLSTSHYYTAIHYKKNQNIPIRKINNFIKNAQRQTLFTRISLFITKEQKQYLDKISEVKKTTTSDYVRNLIENDLLRNI